MARELSKEQAGRILNGLLPDVPRRLALYLTTEREPDHIIPCHAEPAGRGVTRWVPDEDVLVRGGETAQFELRADDAECHCPCHNEPFFTLCPDNCGCR